MVFLRSLLDQADTLADGLFLWITKGRVIESGFLYTMCRVIALLGLGVVWVILSHITVWLWHMFFN